MDRAVVPAVGRPAGEAAAAGPPYIRFDRVTKSFGALTVVDELALDIAKGEFVSLLGPSGSGKTTLLMLLAGFERPTAGSVWVDGRQVERLPPHKRDMGVVFQNYALFPHMSVADNVAFPLRMRGAAKAEIAGRVGRALDMVRLGGLKDRRPAQLSGGQQQRVALARALVFEPAVVLMDEPLGALDKNLRGQMQLDIRELHRRLELTVVFVTHDQTEALTMSDRIAVFNRGRIEQIGAPSEVYDRPATRFVADFIGESNLVEGVVEDVSDRLATVALGPGGRRIVVPATDATRPARPVTVSIRPERVRLGAAPTDVNAFASRVVDSVYHGDHVRVVLQDVRHGSSPGSSPGAPDEAAGRLVAKASRSASDLAAGAATVASFAPADCWVLPR